MCGFITIILVFLCFLSAMMPPGVHYDYYLHYVQIVQYVLQLLFINMLHFLSTYKI